MTLYDFLWKNDDVSQRDYRYEQALKGDEVSGNILPCGSDMSVSLSVIGYSAVLCMCSNTICPQRFLFPSSPCCLVHQKKYEGGSHAFKALNFSHILYLCVRVCVAEGERRLCWERQYFKRLHTLKWAKVG